ncbi:MAG: sugar transferase [Propionibacteriaceae bacterium]|nr:sugar transferase [Propionibacteriaceae bacterium]
MYERFVKRLIDLVLSAVGLLVFSPLMLAIAIWVKLDSPGPVYFIQRRIGRGKRPFSMLKYRTMKTDTPHDRPTHQLNAPEQWVTRAGKVLRKLSLDELPQLWNILIADMSFVGPRPALWNQYDLIEQRDACGANSVRPGLTGWAQINGRDELSIEDKATHDGEYVRRMTLRFDFRCLFLTLVRVINREGIVEGAASG